MFVMSHTHAYPSVRTLLVPNLAPLPHPTRYTLISARQPFYTHFTLKTHYGNCSFDAHWHKIAFCFFFLSLFCPSSCVLRQFFYAQRTWTRLFEPGHSAVVQLSPLLLRFAFSTFGVLCGIKLQWEKYTYDLICRYVSLFHFFSFLVFKRIALCLGWQHPFPHLLMLSLPLYMPFQCNSLFTRRSLNYSRERLAECKTEILRARRYKNLAE